MYFNSLDLLIPKLKREFFLVDIYRQIKHIGSPLIQTVLGQVGHVLVDAVVEFQISIGGVVGNFDFGLVLEHDVTSDFLGKPIWFHPDWRICVSVNK